MGRPPDAVHSCCSKCHGDHRQCLHLPVFGPTAQQIRAEVVVWRTSAAQPLPGRPRPCIPTEAGGTRGGRTAAPQGPTLAGGRGRAPQPGRHQGPAGCCQGGREPRPEPRGDHRGPPGARRGRGAAAGHRGGADARSAGERGQRGPDLSGGAVAEDPGRRARPLRRDGGRGPPGPRRGPARDRAPDAGGAVAGNEGRARGGGGGPEGRLAPGGGAGRGAASRPRSRGQRHAGPACCGTPGAARRADARAARRPLRPGPGGRRAEAPAHGHTAGGLAADRRALHLQAGGQWRGQPGRSPAAAGAARGGQRGRRPAGLCGVGEAAHVPRRQAVPLEARRATGGRLHPGVRHV
mmetsp:Transcript_78511/g.233976  ORF Transcript_78511/g.233976 Transcript_78511/m.233976 type:complete len:350 (-) Transcript_78511:180-1229(-)